jgi:hypothetical protein
VKNDERDAIDVVDMLRLGRLPEAWIAAPATRELRELVRYRAKLVALRSGLKAQVHAVMAKEGVLPAPGRMFGPAGNGQLDAIAMADNYTTRVASRRDLIQLYDREVGRLEGQIHRQLRHHCGYHALPGHQRNRPDHRRLVGGRDRRRRPVPLRRGVVLVGRSHLSPPRVRHQDHPRLDHQAGLEAGAVGAHRSGVP